MVILVNNSLIVHRNLLVSIVHVVYLGHVVVWSQIWRSEGAWLVVVKHLVILIHLVTLHTSTNVVCNVDRLIWEHKTSLSVICERVLGIVAQSIERQLHLSGHDEVVPIFNSHFSQTLRFPGYWLFALNVNVHFLFLN